MKVRKHFAGNGTLRYVAALPNSYSTVPVCSPLTGGLQYHPPPEPIDGVGSRSVMLNEAEPRPDIARVA